MTELEEITRNLFGDDAQRLLDAHAIVPLINPSVPKAGIAGWMDGFDPRRDVKFHSLGLVVGERSGITVWDVDTHDLTLPVEPNVRTSNGSHIYAKHAGEDRKIKPVAGVDVLGEKSFAIFYGPGKQFVHPKLADADVIHEWFEDLQKKSLTTPCRDMDQSYGSELKNRVNEQSYCEFLLSQGYELDKDAVRDQYVKTLSNVSTGSRNTTLYRYTREMVRCGLDLDDLEIAAIDSGLDPYEIEKTMQSAEAAVILDPGKSVFDRVEFWIDNALPLVPSVAHEVMRDVARCAIETNNLAPFIRQQDIADRLALGGLQRDRSWVSTVLTRLDKTFGVVKVVPLGRQLDGKRNPNAYRLCLGGKPISEVDA